MNAQNVAATAWATLGRVAAKELQRPHLEAGGAHAVALQISGTVDEERFVVGVTGTTMVGTDSTRLSSKAPDLNHLIAWLLSKLNGPTREKILRELPEEFAANGNQLPAVDEHLPELAGGMLRRLRAKVQQEIKAPISTTYRLDAES